MSVLDLIQIDNAVKKLRENDNIISASIFTYPNSYEKLDIYVDGVNAFIKLKLPYKMLLFYDDSIPINIINKWSNSNKIILCKYTGPEYSDRNGLFGTIIRYLPMFTNEFKFNYCMVCDVDRHFGQWKKTLNNFRDIININIDKNMYCIPLAGELLTRNIAVNISNLITLDSWYRISAYPITIKYGNILPINILNNFIFDTVNTPEYTNTINYILEYEYEKTHVNQYKYVYGCDELFLLYVMKYHEDNKIDFMYSTNVYTHRSPFYYWLEHVKPSQCKMDEFLNIVGAEELTVSDFLKKYNNTKRNELYSLIKDKFGNNLEFFESNLITECCNRFISFINKDPDNIYIKHFE